MNPSHHITRSTISFFQWCSIFDSSYSYSVHSLITVFKFQLLHSKMILFFHNYLSNIKRETHFFFIFFQNLMYFKERYHFSIESILIISLCFGLTKCSLPSFKFEFVSYISFLNIRIVKEQFINKMRRLGFRGIKLVVTLLMTKYSY